MTSPACRSVRSLRRSRGFTLLEVLVALVVLSIGLLGLSGLQTTGLRGGYSAMLRSQATVLTDDLLDRIRANRVEALDGAYNVTSFSTTAGSEDCTFGSSCGAADRASTDLFEWFEAIDRTLPDGAAAVEVTGAGIATVQIRWVDDRAGGAMATPFQTVTLL